MVRLDPPALVRISGRFWLLPIVTFPKLKLRALAVSNPGVTAVPARGITSVGFGALLVIERLPLAAPADCGANCRLKLVLWPAPRVKGKIKPFTLKPEPERVPCVIVTPEPPVLVRISAAVWLLPTWTVPKLMLEGFAVSEPVARPVPESGRLREASEAVLTNATLPLTAPAACGANATLKFVLCPAANVSGRASPARLNPVPVTVACETVSVEPPELVSVACCFWLLPIRTLPRAMLAGLTARKPAVTPVPESGRLKEEFEASLVNPTVPLTVPAACGANTTLKFALCPAVNVSGTERPV